MKRLPFILLPLAIGGCAEPMRLQYDHGRSYAEAFNRQADLTRTSAASGVYTLTGVEGLELRKRVEEATTDEEKGTEESSSE